MKLLFTLLTLTFTLSPAAFSQGNSLKQVKRPSVTWTTSIYGAEAQGLIEVLEAKGSPSSANSQGVLELSITDLYCYSGYEISMTPSLGCTWKQNGSLVSVTGKTGSEISSLLSFQLHIRATVMAAGQAHLSYHRLTCLKDPDPSGSRSSCVFEFDKYQAE